ncbi:jerky protein homolog-like [Anthonomus grandis grandis]|uniref:jerky protein homolog-like n=1 Tax=Anthonomus grandis grandis TaxID=2921223 RepID=UPI0021650D7D|nr:jerky protein homolog-like [Anthonomus grandis grandis]
MDYSDIEDETLVPTVITDMEEDLPVSTTTVVKRRTNQRTGANEKRKRNVLTIEQKMEILKQSENNISVAILAKTYNIGKQTVRDIVKKKSQLQSFVAKADSAKAISDGKSLKGSTFRELDDAMTKWFLQKRSVGVPISGPMCTRQAEKFHKQLKIKGNFSASSGWLYRFKKRHGIRELAVQGKKLSANDVAMAVLLLDNAPSHPDVEQLKSTDGNIFVAYFPPNVTSIAQPMDQGVIETMKRLYRKDLMYWKRLNLKEAIYAVARAWSDVKVDHIKKSFYKIMTLEHEDGSEDENHLNEGELSVGNIATIASQIKGLEEIDNKEIQEWIECDHQETGYQIIDDDYLHNKSSAESSDKSSDENESSDKNDCVIMTSHREARDAVNRLIQYFEEQPVTLCLNR